MDFTETSAIDLPEREVLQLQCAAKLRQAQSTGNPCEKLSERHPSLSIEDAYAIQMINVRRRIDGVDEDPARWIGHKVGLTSSAIQNWLKVDEPDFGCLLSDMMINPGGQITLDRMLQPRAEGELAFVLGEPLEGPGITVVDVLRATEFVLPAIEIVDSRVRDWDISIVDTVADNASSSMFVLGTRPIDLEEIDFRLIGMALRKNGRVVSTGAGAACLGDPCIAIAWLANKLAEFDQRLDEGDIVLSGALGPVTPIAPGDYLEVSMGTLGRAHFSIARQEES